MQMTQIIIEGKHKQMASGPLHVISPVSRANFPSDRQRTAPHQQHQRGWGTEANSLHNSPAAAQLATPANGEGTGT